jgi:uncharacterized protein YutE (UPF0331/DUF86 family)
MSFEPPTNSSANAIFRAVTLHKRANDTDILKILIDHTIVKPEDKKEGLRARGFY